MIEKVFVTNILDEKQKINFQFLMTILQIVINKMYKYIGREDQMTIVKKDFKNGNFQNSISSNYDGVQESLLNFGSVM